MSTPNPEHDAVTAAWNTYVAACGEQPSIRGLHAVLTQHAGQSFPPVSTDPAHAAPAETPALVERVTDIIEQDVRMPDNRLSWTKEERAAYDAGRSFTEGAMAAGRVRAARLANAVLDALTDPTADMANPAFHRGVEHGRAERRESDALTTALASSRDTALAEARAARAARDDAWRETEALRQRAEKAEAALAAIVLPQAFPVSAAIEAQRTIHAVLEGLPDRS